MDLDRSSSVCAVLAFLLAWWAMRQSLPPLDGAVQCAGARAPKQRSSATRAASRSSPPPRAPISPTRSGFAHGQDRFFQMDLSRRLAAGELSELFGAVAHQTGHRACGASDFARSRAASIEATRAGRARHRRGLCARRECRPREPRFASLGIPAAARAAARVDCPRIRCSWCIRCGGSCSTARSRDEIDRRRLERAAAAQRRDAAEPRTSSSRSSTPATRTGTRLTTAADCTLRAGAPAPNSARVLTQSFPGQLRSRRRRRARGTDGARQQQLGGGRRCTRNPASR